MVKWAGWCQNSRCFDCSTACPPTTEVSAPEKPLGLSKENKQHFTTSGLCSPADFAFFPPSPYPHQLCFLYTFSVFFHFKCFCQPLLCCLKMRGIFTCGGLLLVTLLLTSVDAKGILYGSPYRYNLHKSGSVPQYNPGKPMGHHK